MAQNQNNHGDKQASGKQGFAKDHELASEAGRKGGQASHGGGHSGGGAKQKHSEVASGKGSDSNNFANDRQKASEAGRKGGQHS